MKEIKYIANHKCPGIVDQGNVAVDMCEVNGDVGWFLHLFYGFNETETLVPIYHCPYCNKTLTACYE